MDNTLFDWLGMFIQCVSKILRADLFIYLFIYLLLIIDKQFVRLDYVIFFFCCYVFAILGVLIC